MAKKSPESPRFEQPAGRDRVLERVHSDMERVGWTAMHVFGDDDEPPFSYTIGLSRTYQHPEIIISGLRPETAHDLLTGFAQRIKNAGQPLPIGRKIEHIAMVPLILKPVSDDRRLIQTKVARVVLGDHAYTLLQAVWPNRAGKFPWDPSWNKRLDKTQARYWEF